MSSKNCATMDSIDETNKISQVCRDLSIVNVLEMKKGVEKGIKEIAFEKTREKMKKLTC